MTTATSVFDKVVKNAQSSCPYCHQPLKTISVKVMGKTYASLPCAGSCGCEASKQALEPKVRLNFEQKDDKYRQAGIAPMFFTARLENPDYYTKLESGKSLFISGDVGTGKTYLASALAIQTIDSGKTVRFETTLGILRELKDSFHSGPSNVLERCLDCDLLIIDDLGKETPTDFALSVLFEIFDLRYSNLMPYVITSNYQGDDLVGRMAQANETTAKALVSRICGTCSAIDLNGADRRRQ